MKRLTAGLAVLMLLPLHTAQAAYQSIPVKTRQVIIEDGVERREVSRPSYSFAATIISDSEGLKGESYRDGRLFVTAKSGERYAIQIYNPLPVRVGVNVTVDGVNTISGKPSGIADGDKWLIEPYGTLVLRGWQVNGDQARRFFFTDKPKSYAKWRGDLMGKDLAANCGVIGVAFFWSQKELDAYYASYPQYRYTARLSDARQYGESLRASKSSMGAPATTEVLGSMDRLQNKIQSAPSEIRKKAGTGMGERESHPTQTVDFDFDSGMYRLNQALVIYYDFASAPVPNPFPELSYAPEMP